jgi:hypothetical protein
MQQLRIVAKPPVKAEERELEPTVIQRRILLSFYATLLAGVFLCVAYLAGRTVPAAAAKTEKPWLVVSVPNPPVPLTEPADAGNDGPKRSPLKLDILATKDAWVEVEADGQAIYANLVLAEQSLSFEASERIRFKTGNAPGLELHFNGVPVVANGVNRFVRTFEFTNEGTRVAGLARSDPRLFSKTDPGGL